MTDSSIFIINNLGTAGVNVHSICGKTFPELQCYHIAIGDDFGKLRSISRRSSGRNWKLVASSTKLGGVIHVLVM